MPPKQRITREMILESAFKMFCREGMDVVNARSVAKALGCSTQPIFSYYSGMQELRDTLDQKAQELFADQVLSTAQGDAWLVDLFAAYVRFACAQPQVFWHLYEGFRNDKTRMNAYEPVRQALVAHIAEKEGVSEEKAAEVCLETMTYVCGLATLSMVHGTTQSDARGKIEKTYRAILATA